MQTLPNDYTLLRDIDLSKDTSLMLKLNLVGLALFLGCLWLFAWLAAWLRPDLGGPTSFGGKIDLPGLAAILLAFGLILIVHEGVHGLFFWLFTGSRPVFGLKAAYAYAAAPGWYIPRNRYLWVGLAPLIVISLAGLLILPRLPSGWLLAWLLALATNASGAIGDLYVVGWLLGQSPDVLVNDHGDGMRVYAPPGGRGSGPA